MSEQTSRLKQLNLQYRKWNEEASLLSYQIDQIEEGRHAGALEVLEFVLRNHVTANPTERNPHPHKVSFEGRETISSNFYPNVALFPATHYCATTDEAYEWYDLLFSLTGRKSDRIFWKKRGLFFSVRYDNYDNSPRHGVTSILVRPIIKIEGGLDKVVALAKDFGIRLDMSDIESVASKLMSAVFAASQIGA